MRTHYLSTNKLLHANEEIRQTHGLFRNLIVQCFDHSHNYVCTYHDPWEQLQLKTALPKNAMLIVMNVQDVTIFTTENRAMAQSN